MPETAQQYIQRILGYVEGQDAVKVQRTTAAKLRKSIQGLTPKQLKWRPEPGKWSIAEIIAHLADAEVVGSWRMRSIIGENGITVQPYDQNAWASVFDYQNRDTHRSLEAFRVLRENNLSMLKEISPRIWDNHGIHLERGKETVSHVVRMFAGHDTNHILQVEQLVQQLKTMNARGKKNKSKKAKGKKRH